MPRQASPAASCRSCRTLGVRAMSFLSQLLFGREPQQVQHAVFGKILLFKAKHGSYWEAEPTLNGAPFSVAIETTGDLPPTEEQAHFFEAVVKDMNAAFAMAAPALVPEYEKWMRSTFPSEWQAAFKPVGMSVPLEGRASNPWELSFECLTDKGGHQFTCYFEGGSPHHVSIDG
jgi:hypothetical protein